MLKEYRSVSEIYGPIMVVENVEGVKYDELVEIRTNSGEFMIRDKKLIKKITKDVARHVDGELLKLGM